MTTISATQEITAYSPSTDTTYPSWDALVEAEANGYVVTASMHNVKNNQYFTASYGPFDSQRLANNGARRFRSKFNRGIKEHPDVRLLVVNVRPLWKEIVL